MKDEHKGKSVKNYKDSVDNDSPVDSQPTQEFLSFEKLAQKVFQAKPKNTKQGKDSK